MIPKNAFRAVLVITILSLASPAMAAKGFDYTFVDIGYQYTSGDPENLKLGLIDGSFDVFKYVALRAGFRRGEMQNYQNREPKYTEFQAGAQGHYPLIKNKLDAVAGANWFYDSINDSQLSSNSDSGGIFDAGVRYQVLKPLELDAGVRYRSGNFSKTFGTFGAVYKITKTFSINANTDLSNDIQKYFIGLRIGL